MGENKEKENQQLIFDERKKEKEKHWHPKSTMALKTDNVN